MRVPETVVAAVEDKDPNEDSKKSLCEHWHVLCVYYTFKGVSSSLGLLKVESVKLQS